MGMASESASVKKTDTLADFGHGQGQGYIIDLVMVYILAHRKPLI